MQGCRVQYTARMASRRSSPRFVGREQELDQFLRRCSAVLESGSGATALVTGEPGIGKSRFCHEISIRARAAGWHVLSGSCDAFAIDARPLNALQEMVPEIRQVLEEIAPEQLATPAWKAVAQLDSSQRKPSSLSGGSLVELATNLFGDLSRRAPLLVTSTTSTGPLSRPSSSFVAFTRPSGDRRRSSSAPTARPR